MPDLDKTLAILAQLVKRELKLERDRRKNLEDATLSKAFRDEQDAGLLKQVESVRWETRLRLDELVRYPPFHDRHFSKLDQFHDNTGRSFEKSWN